MIPRALRLGQESNLVDRDHRDRKQLHLLHLFLRGYLRICLEFAYIWSGARLFAENSLELALRALPTTAMTEQWTSGIPSNFFPWVRDLVNRMRNSKASEAKSLRNIATKKRSLSLSLSLPPPLPLFEISAY